MVNMLFRPHFKNEANFFKTLKGKKKSFKILVKKIELFV